MIRNPIFVNRKLKKIEHFTDLEVWMVNYELAISIYKITKKFPRDEKYGIIDQLRRAVSSINANIAEAWGRYYYGDKIRFLYQARGSGAETHNFLILAYGLGYLSGTEYKALEEKLNQGFQLLNGLIRSTEKRKRLNREL